jgi:stage II sporulation protein AA (anti-sigma F factor antagonist)
MDGALLKCQFAQGDAADVLHVSGELDVASGPTLEHAVARSLDGQGGDFRLDLRGLRFMDSSGAKALVRVHNRVEWLGRHFVIVSPTRPVRRVLDGMGLEQLLDIEDCHAYLLERELPEDQQLPDDGLPPRDR